MNTLTMALTPCTVAVPMVTASHWAFWTLAPIMVLAALGMVCLLYTSPSPRD